MNIHDWLTKTTAADVMVRDVVTLDPGDSLAQAAALLLRKQISGAPVVDASGVCRGVLSANDLLQAEEKVSQQRAELAQSSFWSSHLALPASIYEQKLAEVRDMIAPASQQPVERFMTTNLVTVREETPVGTITQNLIDAHIHRVIVVDASNHLLGIVSTIDLLAAFLRARGQGEPHA